MRTIATVTALGLALHVLSGCPASTGPIEEDTSCSEDAGDASTFAYPDSGTPSVALDGRWAMFEVTTATVTIAGSSASENRVTTLLIADQTVDGATVSLTEEICTIGIENVVGVCGQGSLVTTVIPEAYLAALPVVTRAGTVSEADGVISYTLDRLYALRGVKLDNPETDALPADPNDPAYFDQDGDGKPGMTVRFTEPGIVKGELYIGQRDWTEFSGEVVAGGRIEGRITWDSVQQVLGSNPESVALTSPKSAPHGDPSKSYFVMVRVADDFDCAALIAARSELFPN